MGLAATAMAVTAWGASSVVAKIIDMGALALITYRFLLFGIVMAVFLAARRTPLSWGAMRHSFWGGLTLGVDAGLFFTAVKYTTVANATIVNALQVVLVSLISSRMYGERMRGRDIAYAAVAMGGVAVVAFGSSGSPGWSWGGDLAAVGALFAWSAYFVATRHCQKKVPTQQYTACVAVYVGAMNAPFAVLFGQDLSWPSAGNWMWLVVMAFGSGIFGHVAMNWSLQTVPLWLASTLTLFIPVVASVLAWVAFGESLTPLQMGAMALVVVALGMIVQNQRGARRDAGGADPPASPADPPAPPEVRRAGAAG